MRFISITKSINIRLDWANITGTVLKAGTPISLTGAVANSSAAVGILADDAEKSSAEVAVVTEGSIDLAEITASYGELEDDCIAAIKGIAFIGSDGDPIVPSGGGLPDYSEASNGDVLSIEDGAPAWTTPSGGGGNNIVIVPYEWSDAQNKWVTDASLSDALSAYQDGKLIVLDSGAGQFVANNVDIGAQSIRWVQLEGGMNEFVADWFLWTASGISYVEYYWTASTD